MLALGVAAMAGLVLVACGDGNEAARTPEPPAGTSATVPSGTGPQQTIRAPKLPDGNIEAVFPAHASVVKQASTRSPNQQLPGGLCVDVNFKDTPELAQWFRMSLDDVEVTADRNVVWAPKRGPSGNFETGRMCYAPVDGLAVGKHKASVSVQNPTNPSEPTRHLVRWEFEVVP